MKGEGRRKQLFSAQVGLLAMCIRHCIDDLGASTFCDIRDLLHEFLPSTKKSCRSANRRMTIKDGRRAEVHFLDIFAQSHLTSCTSLFLFVELCVNYAVDRKFFFVFVVVKASLLKSHADWVTFLSIASPSSFFFFAPGTNSN